MSGALICDGEVQITLDGAPVCSGAWLLQPVPLPFSPEQVDPVILGTCFVAGFSIVLTFALLGFGGRSILKAFQDN